MDNKGKKKMATSYPMTPFNKLNWRTQSVGIFKSEQKPNPATGKPETRHKIKNDAGYDYKVMTPPCNALFPHLGSGGNFGGKYSKTQQTSSVTSQLLMDGEDEHFKTERAEFFKWLGDFNDNCLDQMYAADPLGAASAVRTKINKRYGKKKTPEECEEMAKKAFKKTAMVPLKTNDGETKIVVKCPAFDRDGVARRIRYVQENGDDYSEMETVPTIRNGALLCIPFQIRPYAMAKDKYGLTYTLITDIVVLSTGRGVSSAPIEEIETANRPYNLSVAEGREGKIYLNIKDAENRRFEFRTASTEVVFSDLGGTGTLGKIAGVTEDNAKYSGTTKEDIDNEASVAFYDYVQKMSDDIVDYCIKDDKLLSKLKADSKEEAEEMATETGESFDHCFRTVIKDAFNSPIQKRDEDEHRQFRFSQRVYTYGENKQQNKIPLFDATGQPIEADIRRNAMIAPVLSPSVYFMADGKFGLKFDISLLHGIRVDSNPEPSEKSGGILYSLKRAASDISEPEGKRARIEA